MSVLATALPALLRHLNFFFLNLGMATPIMILPTVTPEWYTSHKQTCSTSSALSLVVCFSTRNWSLFLQDLANYPCKLSLICSSMCWQLATARWASTSKMFLLREKNRYLKHKSSSYIQIMRNKMIAVQLMVSILPNGCLKNYSLLMMNLLARLQQRYRLRNSV